MVPLVTTALCVCAVRVCWATHTQKTIWRDRLRIRWPKFASAPRQIPIQHPVDDVGVAGCCCCCWLGSKHSIDFGLWSGLVACSFALSFTGPRTARFGRIVFAFRALRALRGFTVSGLLTLRVSRTGLAASSRQQDRIVAGRLRALVLDVPALDPSDDAALLLELRKK